MAWFVCPVFLKPYHKEGLGDHGSGWCNQTDKAGPWCVIVAAMLIRCIYSNWTPKRIFAICVSVCVFGCLCEGLCGCMWVRDTWELELALQRQVDHPGWPVLTGWYVSFSGGCWGGHTVVMPAWLMARYLSVCQSGQAHSPQLLHGVAFKRATEQGFMLSGYVIPLFSGILQWIFLSMHLKACITI